MRLKLIKNLKRKTTKIVMEKNLELLLEGCLALIRTNKEMKLNLELR